ncbi:MAG: hypothetical protein F4185_04350 [Chloroflexi bacterium]|nr:hypothetical protein [Chloroflexota bacterium]MYF65158.1 hypothetical protein [Chloroflexota bacterium]MYK35358.1 hypothetical protein [Chloroflexota bacterium]
MRTSARGLERYYGCLLAQAALQPIAEQYVVRWMDAVERGGYPPDVAELFEAAAAERVPVLSPAPVVSYLRQCFKTGRVPDETRIVLAIAHAYAEGDLMNLDRTCRCPARRPVFRRPSFSSFTGE